ncbi:anti-sigma factor [Sporosarcina sp. E16_8]|uniref:anti-sigma factor n=1 Tax=Sporosarcina sp. E16_8 TaxID=2789295 RepID=UPI001A91F507|nr:anti-sigma factor [Sporosarcina sp. E16_8]MBO0589144.1 anti-sigma factor [Sporosarcina sp. E16_8]
MNEQCHLLIDYFNRVLTDEELKRFETHMTECPSCREELIEWEALTEDLPYLTEEVEVPTDLKSRVFAALSETTEDSDKVKVLPQLRIEDPPSKRFKVAVPVLAAALFASLVTNAYLVNENNKELEVAVGDIQLIAQTALVPQPGGGEASAVAMLLSDRGEDVLLVDAAKLPELQEGELYQVWVIEGEKPYPAGIVKQTEAGGGSVSHRLKELVGKWDTIAITIEKEPNLAAPQGTIVLAGGI